MKRESDKLSLIFWLIGCILLLTINAEAQKKPANSRVVFSAPKKRAALLIGISDYDSIPLRNPVNDARLINAYLHFE